MGRKRLAEHCALAKHFQNPDARSVAVMGPALSLRAHKGDACKERKRAGVARTEILARHRTARLEVWPERVSEQKPEGALLEAGFVGVDLRPGLQDQAVIVIAFTG